MLSIILSYFHILCRLPFLSNLGELVHILEIKSFLSVSKHECQSQSQLTSRQSWQLRLGGEHCMWLPRWLPGCLDSGVLTLRSQNTCASEILSHFTLLGWAFLFRPPGYWLLILNSAIRPWNKTLTQHLCLLCCDTSRLWAGRNTLNKELSKHV